MAFQFKVQLKDIADPPVWRRLSVPDQFSFLRFHKVIQAAFGWENRHLFQFSPTGFNSDPIIGVPDPDWDELSVLDSKKIRLNKVFTTPGQEFTYTYDLGDDWVHTIVLEEITGEKLLRADCIAGQGNCPPEDCGGTRGYASLKEIMNDPKHPEYREMKEWLGVSRVKNWDAGHFSLDRAHYTVGRM
jgi:hypothetical protein